MRPDRSTPPSARVTGRPSTAPAPGSRGPRRARRSIRRIDPWSVLRFTFVYSVFLLIMLVVAVAVLYSVLNNMGVFTAINETVADLFNTEGEEEVRDFFTARTIIGGAALIGAVNVFLVTALATLGAFLYNLCADMVGGIDVTLAERD